MTANPIQSIQIENFQSHQKTEITVAPNGQLTVLTGPSDAGKTAIIRALRWVLYNIPQGTDFIRHGASFARVTVEYTNGYKVIRERSRRGYNRYVVITPALVAMNDRQVYEGFGNSVPLEVQQVTGVTPVTIGDMELNLNISEQLDGPFLGKTVSTGARAKVLGKLAGTEEVDYAAKTLATDLYRKRQDEKRLAVELQELDEKIRAYDYLDKLEKTITAIKNNLEQLKKDMVLLEKLHQYNNELQMVHNVLDEKQRIITALGYRFEQLNYMIPQAENDIATLQQLVKLSNENFQVTSALYFVNKLMDKTSTVGQATSLVEQTVQDMTMFMDLEKLNHNMLAAQRRIVEAEKTLSLTASTVLCANFVGQTAEMFHAYNRLTELSGHVAATEYGIGQATWVIESAEAVTEVSRLLGEIERNFAALDKLSTLNEKLLEATREVTRSNTILQYTRKNTDRLTALIKDTEQKIKQQISLCKYTSDINIISFNVKQARASVESLNVKVRQSEQEYIHLMTSIGVCPTCGSEINVQKLKEVI